MKTEEVAHVKNTDVTYIGIDVSKETLDIDAGVHGVKKIGNAPMQVRKALEEIAKKTRDGKPPHIRLESTGPYIGALVAECQAAAMRYSILNPWKVKCFAKSIVEAKTDAIDASVIRRRAEVRRPMPTPPPRKARAELDWLLLARESVMKSAVAAHSVLETVKGAAAKPLRQTIAYIEKKVAKYDLLISEAVGVDGEVAGLAGALGGVDGIGALSAAKVIAWVPEIGTLGRRKAAALVGLAPHTRESGKWKGKSRIGGGRKHVRDALYMPATVAIRHNAELKRVYNHLAAKGKPYKVALTAVMRKLICRLDSVARERYAKRKGVEV